MKHLLNNISEEEKNSILEQHKGGMKIFNDNFNKMVDKKLGQVDLYEQTEKKANASTENTRKLSDIDPNIFGSTSNLERDALAVSNNVKHGISALKLFRKISEKIYELNKGKEESTTQALYMGDKKNPSGERLKALIGGDNYSIDPGLGAREQFNVAKYTYGELKNAMDKDDQGMAILYNTWLDTKI